MLPPPSNDFGKRGFHGARGHRIRGGSRVQEIDARGGRGTANPPPIALALARDRDSGRARSGRRRTGMAGDRLARGGALGVLRRGGGGAAGRADGAWHDQSDVTLVAADERGERDVLVDGQDGGVGADIAAGAQGGAAVDLAGAAGDAGVVHAGLLAGAVVARALEKLIGFGNTST